MAPLGAVGNETSSKRAVNGNVKTADRPLTPLPASAGRGRKRAREKSHHSVMVVAVVVVVVIVVVVLVEVEQVEQVADRRHVARDVAASSSLSCFGFGRLSRLRVAERGVELPVALDELHERRVLIVDVADVAAASRTAKPRSSGCAGRCRRSRPAG